MAKRPLRVALVHDWLTGMRGGEKVLEAIAGFFPNAPIYTLFHFPGTVSAALEAHPIRTSFLQRAPGLRRHYRRYLPLFPAAIEDFDLSQFDLVVSTSHCVAKGVIPAPGARHLCYCHTPMRYAWDQEHAYFPKRRGVAARIRGQILSRLRAWDVSSSERVDQFFANSSFVAQRIARYYRRSAKVLPPPVDVDYFDIDDAADAARSARPRQSAQRPDYCLSVAALAPYKRHEVAIAACAALGRELVLVGDGPERTRLERLGGSGVRILGRVSSAELRELYRGAAVFVQPGIEDFGIAAVEALACGTPVVGAAAGGLLDIVEDGVHGALFAVDAGAPGLAQAIDKALSLGFNPLNLRERAVGFSTSRFRQRLQAALRSQCPELEPVLGA